MATNPYISKKVRSEQSLYEDLVIESLKFYGEDIYYIPREIVNKDTIFADDVPSRFSDAYKIETYIENTEGFDGEGDLFTKFGIELRDQATFVFARRRWKKLIGDNLAEVGFRPREGDIIYLPMSNSMFEVLKVETETPFYQLSQLPTFRLQCELFEYSDEDFDTNIASIDAVEYEGAYQNKVTMQTLAETELSFTTEFNENGEVDNVNILSGGFGFVDAPTLTVEEPTGPSKFGRTSLYSDVGRGLERNYLFYGETGTVEAFVYPDNINQNNQALFMTGGDSDKNQMMWGINNNNKLVYSFHDDDGQPQQILSNSNLPSDQWSHLLIGVDSNGSGVNNKLFVYINGELISDSVTDRPLNLISEREFSVGATAARDFNGVSYSAFNGFIDEYHARVGNRSDLTATGDYSVADASFSFYIVQGNGINYTFDNGNIYPNGNDRIGGLTTAFDPTLNIYLGDTLVLNNLSGGHPLEIVDSVGSTVVSTGDIVDNASTFVPSTIGTYQYQCTVAGHESMVGNIIVTDKPILNNSIVPTSEYDSGSSTAILDHFNGSIATVSATLANGSVSAITITDSGSNYRNAPSITTDRTVSGGNFLINETVTQTNANYTMKGEVTRWSDSDRILQLAHVGSTDGTFKQFSTGAPVVGASSNAQWVPKLVEDLQEIQPTAQNKVFDDFEADFLDFSESNPFGDMT